MVILGGILIFASRIPPKEAVSNVAAWANIFHIPIPDLLRNKTADVWIFWLGLMFVFIYISSFTWGLIGKLFRKVKLQKLEDSIHPPNLKKAKKVTKIISLDLLKNHPGLKDVSTAEKGRFELTMIETTGSQYSETHVMTCSNFSTHFYASVNIGPVPVLDASKTFYLQNVTVV